ncbi:unnamed protein product [Protopolystoma xenopodis]|uniref:Uncharacterized protein n=1 Tax=Protopolystoma xenopodis TaxID=117903 RepID=A0A448XHB1_9PLAT|nr:unnamed protein product [Protopolystoma xenopodis]
MCFCIRFYTPAEPTLPPSGVRSISRSVRQLGVFDLISWRSPTSLSGHNGRLSAYEVHCEPVSFGWAGRAQASADLLTSQTLATNTAGLASGGLRKSTGPRRLNLTQAASRAATVWSPSPGDQVTRRGRKKGRSSSAGRREMAMSAAWPAWVWPHGVVPLLRVLFDGQPASPLWHSPVPPKAEPEAGQTSTGPSDWGIHPESWQPEATNCMCAVRAYTPAGPGPWSKRQNAVLNTLCTLSRPDAASAIASIAYASTCTSTFIFVSIAALPNTQPRL